MRLLCENPLCTRNAQVAATTYRGTTSDTHLYCRQCAAGAGAHLIEPLPEDADE